LIGRRGVTLELADIQGGVLRPYRLPAGAYVFVRFDDRDRGRRWLAWLLDQVTTAVPPDVKRHEKTLNLAFSYSGLEALGLPADVLASFPDDFREGPVPRSARLGDTGESAPERWDKGLGTGETHVLVALTARREGLLFEQLIPLRRSIKDARLTIIHEQRAAVLGDRLGHFRLREGIGEVDIQGGGMTHRPGGGVPLRGGGWRPLKAGEFFLGYEDEDGVLPSAPRDPLGRNSTYAVYRKLYMNVVLWNEYLERAAVAHGRGREEIVAKMLGRWPDGTPLVLSPDQPDPDIANDRDRANDFRYAQDPNGVRCPIGSHVRRANPRDALDETGRLTKRHRIIRRGMPYGQPITHPTEEDGVDRGLIFICFQASIERQFETIQALWCNDGNIFRLGDDKDFLLGDGEGSGKMTIQGDPPRFLTHQPSFVVTKGTEYLFQPGITGLRALANGPSAPA
jgi:Dyp-type peroxidase family